MGTTESATEIVAAICMGLVVFAMGGAVVATTGKGKTVAKGKTKTRTRRR